MFYTGITKIFFFAKSGVKHHNPNPDPLQKFQNSLTCHQKDISVFRNTTYYSTKNQG
jgi:hypothetical protein